MKKKKVQKKPSAPSKKLKPAKTLEKEPADVAVPKTRIRSKTKLDQQVDSTVGTVPNPDEVAECAEVAEQPSVKVLRKRATSRSYHAAYKLAIAEGLLVDDAKGKACEAHKIEAKKWDEGEDIE